MNEFWILILVALFATNSVDKAESVQLIDEIFGEGWWDNDKAEEWHKLTLEQTFHYQIDRQNTQIGQIEPNSTDQNPPLTESDHFDEAKNGEEQNKRIKEMPSNENIALGVNRSKIYEWKKEFGLKRKTPKNERKNLIEKFDQMKAELTRAGFKNSYNHENDKTVAKELGLNYTTIYAWKRELGQTTPKKHSHSEQKKLMKLYYEIKDKNPKISDKDIAKKLRIGKNTLVRWKKQCERQQLHPNSVDGYSVEENAGANVQELGTRIRGIFE